MSDDEKRIKVMALTRDRLKHRQYMYYRDGMNGLSCHDCVYFNATIYAHFQNKDEGIYASQGVCRKDPPGIEIDESGETVSRWPSVEPNEDWCGEHVENERLIPDFEMVWEECYAEVFRSAKEETE